MGSWRVSHKRAQFTQVAAGDQAGSRLNDKAMGYFASRRSAGAAAEGMTLFVIEVIDKGESTPMLQRLTTAPWRTLLQGWSAHSWISRLVCRVRRVSFDGYAVNEIVEETLFR